MQLVHDLATRSLKEEVTERTTVRERSVAEPAIYTSRTFRIPRSGLVQEELCAAYRYAELIAIPACICIAHRHLR